MTSDGGALSPGHPESLFIKLDNIMLEGMLTMPKAARMLVIFIDDEKHNAGSRFIAHELNRYGCATLIISLLTTIELNNSTSHRSLYDIALLSGRLKEIVTQIMILPETRGLPVSCLATGIDCAAALNNAALYQNLQMVMTLNGRPDLSDGKLQFITCPVLFIVSGHDAEILALNRIAQEKIDAECQLDVIPDILDLFESEKSIVQTVTHLTGWLDKHIHNEIHK